MARSTGEAMRDSALATGDPRCGAARPSGGACVVGNPVHADSMSASLAHHKHWELMDEGWSSPMQPK